MFEALERAASELARTEAGWVHRRDAADALGAYAARALSALHQHREDSDTDVRAAVEAALGQASAATQGVAPRQRAYTVEDLARSCEREPVRTVSAENGGWRVTVQLSEDRRQVVHIAGHERQDGAPMLRIHTICAQAPSEKLRAWALRANEDLSHCALAITGEDREEQLILVSNYLLSETSPVEVRATVREIAFYGDWLEKKAGGGDVF